VLDEPFSGLDVETKAALAELLARATAAFVVAAVVSCLALWRRYE
jgi:ABC-type Mn2+/Zn2+ transport system ATPase subunit